MEARELLELLPHRPPFLLVDRVVEIEPGHRASALKCVSINEPWFQGHFPGEPIMPGVLLTEAMAQVAAIVAMSAAPEHAREVVYMAGLDRVRFRRPVHPGDRLRVDCEKVSVKQGLWIFDARILCEGERVAEARLLATFTEPNR